MFFSFIKKCRFKDGRCDFYAHVVLADDIEDAKDKIRNSFKERNVGIGNAAILEEIINFDSSNYAEILYDKACKKSLALSERKENQKKSIRNSFED